MFPDEKEGSSVNPASDLYHYALQRKALRNSVPLAVAANIRCRRDCIVLCHPKTHPATPPLASDPNWSTATNILADWVSLK